MSRLLSLDQLLCGNGCCIAHVGSRSDDLFVLQFLVPMGRLVPLLVSIRCRQLKVVLQFVRLLVGAHAGRQVDDAGRLLL